MDIALWSYFRGMVLDDLYHYLKLLQLIEGQGGTVFEVVDPTWPQRDVTAMEVTAVVEAELRHRSIEA